MSSFKKDEKTFRMGDAGGSSSATTTEAAGRSAASRDQKFHSGDQVLLSTAHLQLKNAPVRKLKRRFVGPFFVVRSGGTSGLRAETCHRRGRYTNVFHTSLLRPFRTSQWSTTARRGDAELEPEDDEPYEVEKLLRWRWTGTQWQEAQGVS